MSTMRSGALAHELYTCMHMQSLRSFAEPHIQEQLWQHTQHVGGWINHCVDHCVYIVPYDYVCVLLLIDPLAQPWPQRDITQRGHRR
jgi:hypothetical protein